MMVETHERGFGHMRRYTVLQRSAVVAEGT